MVWQNTRLHTPSWWHYLGIYLPLLLWGVLFPTASTAASGEAQNAIPIVITIDSFTYTDVDNTYQLTVSINWPREVKRLRLLIQEADGGKDIEEHYLTVNNLALLQVSLSGAKLEEGREYQVIIQGENFQNEAIEKLDDNSSDSMAERMTLAQRPFKHEPPSLAGVPVAIKSVNVDWATQRMLIDLNLDRAALSRLDKIQGYIKDKESGAQIYTIEPQLFQGLPIIKEIPAAMQGGIEPQSYELFLTFTTSDDMETTNETPYEFTPPLQPQQSRWQRIAATLSTPWLLVGILMVIAATTLWITLQNNREKTRDPLPPAIDQTGRYVYTPSAESRRTIRAHITLLRTPDRSQIVDELFADFPITIGREGCTINIAGDGLISRRHLRIERHRDQLAIVDLHSRNGTAVANAQLVPEKPLGIAHTAVVTLGRHTEIRIEVVS